MLEMFPKSVEFDISCFSSNAIYAFDVRKRVHITNTEKPCTADFFPQHISCHMRFYAIVSYFAFLPIWVEISEQSPTVLIVVIELLEKKKKKYNLLQNCCNLVNKKYYYFCGAMFL